MWIGTDAYVLAISRGIRGGSARGGPRLAGESDREPEEDQSEHRMQGGHNRVRRSHLRQAGLEHVEEQHSCGEPDEGQSGDPRETIGKSRLMTPRTTRPNSTWMANVAGSLKTARPARNTWTSKLATYSQASQGNARRAPARITPVPPSGSAASARDLAGGILSLRPEN